MKSITLSQMLKRMSTKPKVLVGRFENIDVNAPFDFKKHKDNFPCYTEVCILKDGTIKYAVPSHVDFLVELAKVNPKDCPSEYWCSTLDWLMSLTGAIAVWTDYYRGKPNLVQLRTLSHLKESGLYVGDL